MSARPTRRGWAVAAVALAGVALGWLFGGRSLNVVVMPAAAAFVLTGLHVARYDRPTVTRTAPEHAHQGETRTVAVSVDARHEYPVTVRESLAEGLVGDGVLETVADGRESSFEVELGSRGEHVVGPTELVATDPFGLWTRIFRYARVDRVTVFPRVHDLTDTAGLLTGYIGVTDERGQFEGLREYQRGDPLRDVNWRASAKRPGDLVVTTFAGEGATNRVVVAADANGGRADAVAEAAASVVANLLDAGISVGVVTPDGSVSPATGDAHRRAVFTQLARLDDAHLGRERVADADIAVRSTAERVEISAGDRTRRYRDVVGARRADA
ncbi:DUF58 domain-containing protein [Salarchaeum sp. JOR-1]|uniref:DUF58 domain-containing protein n=1 Tax=Salarchaeum sp. JOR-1 TaxID=2599399 RepID=UPI0011985DCA|nr:DUF58 domain-containing protein [Salarchaeum sp. JOR-1]QDX40025.1 DUF58 domain-containing protein [Salarchaeum sp. JOR-1]